MQIPPVVHPRPEVRLDAIFDLAFWHFVKIPLSGGFLALRASLFVLPSLSLSLIRTANCKAGSVACE